MKFDKPSVAIYEIVCDIRDELLKESSQELEKSYEIELATKSKPWLDMVELMKESGKSQFRMDEVGQAVIDRINDELWDLFGDISLDERKGDTVLGFSFGKTNPEDLGEPIIIVKVPKSAVLAVNQECISSNIIKKEGK